MSINHQKCNHSSTKSSLQSSSIHASAYICPMHPQVRQDAEGECPICGMALEPEIASSDIKDSQELTDLRKRFWVGFALCLPIVFLEMSGHFIDISYFTSHSVNLYTQFILSIFIIFWSGHPFFIKGYKAFLNKSPNMFSLVSIGTMSTFLYSACVVLFPSIFPDSFKDIYGTIPVYFESASVIIVLVLLGQILELKAREHTGGAIKSLLNLSPKNTTVVTKNGDKEVLVENITVGDFLRIRPGEKIPVDGIVADGSTYIDESMITGEPIPISKQEHDFVIGGTINTTGSIIMKATKIGSDTMLSNIIKMVLNAQRSRGKIQSLVDTVSKWFVPIVILTSLLSFVFWVIFASEYNFSYGLIAAVSVLIIACPCALGLATPMSLIVGIGKGAKNGILVKDAESLEVLEKVNTIILDKTGTLTEGKPKIKNISSTIPGFSKDDLLQLAASLEKKSEHPLALAIISAAKERKIKLLPTADFQSITGKGVVGKINNEKIYLGSQKLMDEMHLSYMAYLSEINKMRSSGATVIFLSDKQSILGFISIQDPLKDSSLFAIKQLKKMNMNVVMLTGDNTITAKAVAKKLGIENYVANAQPQEKVKVVLEYQKKQHVVAMIGDGINDAPALSTANIGIAMGSGTDVAIENAGITLLRGNLKKVSSAIILSRAVMQNIRENLFLAFIYNICGIPIAAGILYPFFGILLSPIFAAAAMSLSSISVIGNALRLNLKKII